jgi:glycosyltransferase involved in cell wall biosynthesis
MRILVLSNLYPPNVVGGYERLCHAAASELAARGHAVTVLTSRHGGQEATYPGLTVLREWELRTGADIYAPYQGSEAEAAALAARNLAALHRALDAVRPDVVFAWNLFFLDASLLDALQAGPHRSVVMLTDNWLLVMRNPQFVAAFFRDHVFGTAEFAPPPDPPAWRTLLGQARRALGRDAAPRGLEAIFGSRFMRAYYAAGGIRFARDIVVHNGVALPEPPEAAPGRAALVSPRELRLLFAGRLVDLKGAHTAVEALALLDPAAFGVARVVLTVVGDGQDEAYLRRFRDAVAASGRAADIEMRPVVPEAALPALFAAHDIYLFPSLYEPFSLTLIHALACGIPTVASRAGGNPEIVEHGRTGLLFRRGDAAGLAQEVARLAREPALRARISRQAQAAARHFTFRRMADGMEAFLEGAA